MRLLVQKVLAVDPQGMHQTSFKTRGNIIIFGLTNLLTLIPHVRRPAHQAVSKYIHVQFPALAIGQIQEEGRGGGKQLINIWDEIGPIDKIRQCLSFLNDVCSMVYTIYI